MTHPIKTRTSVFGVSAYRVGLLLGLAAFEWAHPVEACPTYPPKLQAALEQQFGRPFCVPQCVVCHQTNAGGNGTSTAFANNLVIYGHLTGQPADPVVDKVATYFAAVAAAQGTGMMPNGDSDGDSVSDADELKAGDLPGVAGPKGDNLLCFDIEYGCAGGRIAPAPPPTDRLGLLSAGAVVIGFAAMRRRRRARRT